MSIGERVKFARKAASLTQSDLADKIGTTQQTIHAIENGKIDNPKALADIAKALHVSEKELRYGDPFETSGSFEAIIKPGKTYQPPTFTIDQHLKYRKKLIHAILFFCQSTKILGKTKLFKLLFFSDFQTYKELNRPLTGLPYYAWRLGPVPVSLYEEFDEMDDDLSAAIKIVPTETKNGDMLCVTPTNNVDFNKDLFTDAEIKIMNDVAKSFKNSNASEMIEAIHMTDQPWHQVYEIEESPRGYIPYEYAVMHDK